MGEKKLEDVLKYLFMNYKCIFALYIRFFSFSISFYFSIFISLCFSTSVFVLHTYCLFWFIEVCNSIFYSIFIASRIKFNHVGQGILNRKFLEFFFFHSASCNRLKIKIKIKNKN